MPVDGILRLVINGSEAYYSYSNPMFYSSNGKYLREPVLRVFSNHFYIQNYTQQKQNQKVNNPYLFINLLFIIFNIHEFKYAFLEKISFPVCGCTDV